MTWSPCATFRPVRVIAIAVIVAFAALVVRFWHPLYLFTAFLQLDATNEATSVAALRERPVYVYRDTGGYDGQYYVQIAYHPLLRAPELATAVDSLAYRARRILVPALAWLLAAGRPDWIVHVYATLNLAFWLGLAAILWRVLAVSDARGLVGWFGILFSVGVLSSVRLALTDLPALVLVVAAIWSFEQARPRAAVGWLAAAALARETSLLAAPGLCRGPWSSLRTQLGNLTRVALAAAPLVAWLLYVRSRAAPDDGGVGNFTWPVVGLAEKWRDCLMAARHTEFPLLVWTTLLAVAGLTAQALFILRYPRPADPWWRLGAVYTLLLSFLGTPVWEGFPGAATRVLLPLNVACNVLALRRRAPLAWLLACNLTVFAGLLTLRDVPEPNEEMATVRHWGAAGALRLGEGWFGQEHSSRHRWAWATSRGELVLLTWPRPTGMEARLVFPLRAFTTSSVRVLSRGREIWRGVLTPDLTQVQLPPLSVNDGRLELEIVSDTPGTPEALDPNARRLAFALYDPQVSLTEKRPPKP